MTSINTNSSEDQLFLPGIHMPEAELLCLQEAYLSADFILEYGSGGSTVFAAENGKALFSIESDASWSEKLEHAINTKFAGNQITITHMDIGPTGGWGKPLGREAWRNFPSYAFGFWLLEDLPHPDLILIDGRFRVACFLASLFHCKKETRVLFDDYYDRAAYHIVEEFAKPIRKVGRMALFEISPQSIPKDKLFEILNYFYDPE